MVKLGVIILGHTALTRAEMVARTWASAGAEVLMHIDQAVSLDDTVLVQNNLADYQNINVYQWHRCEWGSWNLVSATLKAITKLLEKTPDLTHIFLSSGSCLPLRPVSELYDFLEENKDTDFIESATVEDVSWTVGGLDIERFTLYFPFSWKKEKLLFDLSVNFQRKLGIDRQIPRGISPHIGSQWWCLTTQTLNKILSDKQKAQYDHYFEGVWIPDESYFQTLVRKHSQNIDSRSLTLSKFDHQGKPHIFYDDHLQLLRRSDCFVARKIWPNAEKLYSYFLGPENAKSTRMTPDPGKIDRVFSRALNKRINGRPGLISMSRQTDHDLNFQATASKYYVFQGFEHMFLDFDSWISKNANVTLHGRLFHQDEVVFENNQSVYKGALTNSAKLRDRNPNAFLTNLIWNTRSKTQAFHFGPSDKQNIVNFIANDTNATLFIISGAWIIPLIQSGKSFAEIRSIAAFLQETETQQLKTLKKPSAKATVHIQTLADAVSNPLNITNLIRHDLFSEKVSHTTQMPVLQNMDKIAEFLQKLKNTGMHPYVMGEFPYSLMQNQPKTEQRKKYEPVKK